MQPTDTTQNLRKTVRRFKDPIHDYIPICAKTSAFIDTRPFQRLRSIKQLGTSYYVWPGASHNRFEHCLGVAHLARLMAEHLQHEQPELGITDRDMTCIELAGLCHDLGHGPWSHVWDGQFIPKALPGMKWQHEDASEMMFDYLVRDNNIDIPEEDVAFVKALIAGDPKRCGGTEKPFLFEIVANKRNGIDVDKFDYIARDSHGIGEKGNISLTRLIHSARVIDDQICYDIKDANQLYELCYTRFSLHKRIYNHKTAKAIEYMIIDALLAAEPHMKIAEQVFNPEKYVYLTDDLMSRIEMSEDPELEESRAIFDRIRIRDLYKCVDYKVFEWTYQDLCREYITPEKIVEAAKNLAVTRPTTDADVAELSAKHVIVDLCPMHYGMKDRNPLDFIKFYSKRNADRCENAGPGDMSYLMPSVFSEVLLRVYTKDERFYGIIQAGYRAVLANMPEITPDDALPNSHSTDTAPATDTAGITSFNSEGDLAAMFRDNTPPPSSHVPALPESSISSSSRVFGRSQSGPVLSGRGLTAGRSISRHNPFTTVDTEYKGHKRNRSTAEPNEDGGGSSKKTKKASAAGVSRLK
ncbi:HD-domain/PDEase-like protein [Neolentinus lepideus HHB14362 ss-1]|uniref:HD-domain/PDEase-like protein n=1 Tax=Neolentinus lepideus HHB14362 ss-1 TaxID=1314782 RepID=A0A165R1E1_9AGAM|nr:HD-domain/PDEase-like protein [Neolentinus lepideus HHB14362 ss-1]